MQVSRLVEAVVKQLASPPLAEGLLLLVHALPVPIDELCKKKPLIGAVFYLIMAATSYHKRLITVVKHTLGQHRLGKVPATHYAQSLAQHSCC